MERARSLTDRESDEGSPERQKVSLAASMTRKTTPRST